MRALLLLAAATVMVPIAAQTSTSATPNTLAGMRDRYRPLLIFEGGDAHRAGQQLTLLVPHASDLRERQVLVVGVRGSEDALPTVLLPPAETERARRRFGIAPDQFAVLLLGKDGGEKLRSNDPIPWNKLRSTIDAMPMRQQESSGRAAASH